MTQAYPLQWPPGWHRTKSPTRAAFKTSFTRARDELVHELALMNASSIVLSSNLAVRQDGLPYANRSEPQDRGVAVYFTYRGKQLVMACDRWDSVTDNIQALRLSVAALRGIHHWGCSEFLEHAFVGFEALPAAGTKRQWWEILGVSQRASREECEQAWKRLARERHPDVSGGSHTAMTELNNAYTESQHGV